MTSTGSLETHLAGGRVDNRVLHHIKPNKTQLSCLRCCEVLLQWLGLEPTTNKPRGSQRRVSRWKEGAALEASGTLRTLLIIATRFLTATLDSE